MKTGTTYLQRLMAANRERLAEAGYLFPGRTWAEQDRAARDVLRLSRNARLAAESTGRWRALVGEMLSHTGTASVFSMEFLSFADAEQAARVVASLRGADVHVVLAVRDAAAAIPAQWQTSCRNGGQLPWPAFLCGVRRTLVSDAPPQDRAARMFQRTQGIPRMLQVWGPLVGPERLHVVTVPPRAADPMLLWRRFAEVLGTDPRTCEAPASFGNPSLGHASSELLRRINVELGVLPPGDTERVLKRALARTILGARAHAERPVVLDRDGLVLAARWNRRVRAAVRDSGGHLVGCLDDLPVGPPDASAPPELREPDAREILAAAGAARDGLLALERRLLDELDATGPGADRPTESGPSRAEPPTTPARWGDAASAERAAVHELADLVRSCLALTR